MANLTTTQYNKICKYWRTMEMLRTKIENFDFSRIRTRNDGYSSDTNDEEEEEEETEFDKLHERLIYFEQEYERYVHKIGLELNNRDYDEPLFNLLNNGVEMDELVVIEPLVVLK
jgi:hypothetical protein